jgi:hypothetical protein
MNYRVEKGHLSKFWDDNFKEFNFVKQPILESEIMQWHSMGYDYVKSFSGSVYSNKNPMPEWISTLDNLFGMYNQTYSFYRMDTLEIMPVHSDHYNTYCRIHDTTTDNVERVILMLEDWKPGHYFELDGVGYVNWRAGDWFKWRGDVPHAASNIGTEPRFTLQITGMPKTTGQMNKLFYRNVPNCLDNLDNPFVREAVFNKVFETHAMVYMNNRYIEELDHIVHDEAAIDILNKEGLHIHLFEPLCSYHRDAALTEGISDIHNMGFYSEFNYPIDPTVLRAEELDSIHAYAVRNNLTNITVHTGDYSVDVWYTHYSDVLTLVCDDLFLKTQRKIEGLYESFSNQFNRDFVCLNWRFTKHRQLVSTFLASGNGYLSWHHVANFDAVSKNLPFDLRLWEQTHNEHYRKLKNNCDVVMQNAPFVVDIPTSERVEIDNPYNFAIWPKVEGYSDGETPAFRNIVANSLSSAYINSFVDIINETRFAQPTANFSEKVFQAMQYKKPFIVVAPPKTLEYIRSLGFKTFNEFWDESYDDELDHGERLAKIFDLIDNITNTSLEDQRETYGKMRLIVEHNLEAYKTFIGDKNEMD